MSLLDALERRAADANDLDGLFRIDHLTTRMRRHAENLLVLAGDSPNRAFSDPVPFVDVLRAAATEVEDYKRIKVVTTTPAALAGPVASDVIHLLAELLENATLFSPSDTQVRIVGAVVANGYAVDIEDRGPGMSAEMLAALNASLADPPLLDMSGSDRLGLFVTATLARRHGISVTLRESLYQGVTAIVLIPRDLVVRANEIGPGAPPQATSPSPEQASTALSAFRKGWQQGTAGSETHATADTAAAAAAPALTRSHPKMGRTDDDRLQRPATPADHH
jgi:K+-sensing histidine kinase KdpD